MFLQEGDCVVDVEEATGGEEEMEVVAEKKMKTEEGKKERGEIDGKKEV